MQTFAEFMAESYESKPPLVWDYPRRGLAAARFVADSVSVLVSFEAREPGGAWHVVFEVEAGEKTEIAQASFEIFNGVLEAVKEFVSVREPAVLVFVTKKDKLARIYQTYLRREAQTLQRLGYRLEQPDRVEPFIEFTLRRTRPSGWNG